VADPDDFARRVVDAIQAWERRTIAGATTDVDGYFGPWLEGEKDFGHQAALVGQEEILKRIEDFGDSAERILILHGPWGRGKSRVLLEAARRARIPIRFIRQDAELTRDALHVSAVDPCILVLEDAQKYPSDQLRGLLGLLQRYDKSIKLVVTCRTSHVEEFAALLPGFAFSLKETPILEVPALTEGEHRGLIVSILGRDNEDAYVIASRTRGNVLAGVVAARLVRQGKLHLGAVERSDEFQATVIRLFRDAVLKEIPKGTEERCREALKLAALAGPIRPADQDEITALARFLGGRPDQLAATLRDLEEAGLLLRIGGLLRIPVDAIAEYELLDACVNARGESLGYAERALRDLWPACARNLLRNLAIAEWDAAQAGRPIKLLEPLWHDLAGHYAALPASGRLELLKILEDVTGLQPRQVLDFVRDALPSGLGPEEADERFRSAFNLREIHDALGRLLAGPLHYSEHVEAACDLLWILAADDTRPPNQHPESPERLLLEVGKYDLRKLLTVHEAFLRWAERRAVGPDPIPGRRLAAYLRPFLAKEGEHTWSDGEKIAMQSFPVSFTKTKKIRERVLDLLQQIGERDDLASAAVAISAIGDVLGPPHGTFGRGVTDDERASWYPEELSGLARLRSIRERHQRLAIDLLVFEEIHWASEHSTHNQLQESTSKLVSEIRAGLEGSIELALTPFFKLHLGHADEDLERHDLDVKVVADNLVGDVPDAAALLSKVTSVARELDAVGIAPQADQLLFHVARRRPELGREIVALFLATPDHLLTVAMPGLVSGILASDPEGGKKSLERLVESGSVLALRALAPHYRRQDWLAALGEETIIRHLKRLLTYQDSGVRKNALLAVAVGKALDKRKRLDLLLTYDLASASDTGDDWAAALEHEGLYLLCTDAERKTVVRKMGDMQSLEYWSGKLLDHFCTVEPAAVVEMLLGRVRRAATAPNGFEAVAHHGDGTHFRNLPVEEKKRALLDLGPLLDGENWRVTWAAQHAIQALGISDDASARETRLTWVRSGDSQLIVRAAHSLRQEAPGAILSEEALITEILAAAAKQGPDCLRSVESEIAVIAYNGVRMTNPGEADPVDLALRDGARAIATKYGPGSPESTFYQRVAEAADARIRDDKQRHDEGAF
jgi:hypothetical protein